MNSTSGKLYFAFTTSDSMWPANCRLQRLALTEEGARRLITTFKVESACNPRHTGSIKAMRRKFGDRIPIPERPPQVRLTFGDEIVIMSLRGLPRLEEPREYTDAEMERATFEYALYRVLHDEEP